MYLVVLAGGSGTGQRASTGLERPTVAAAGSDPEGRSPLQQTVACLEPLVDPMDVVVVTDRRFGQLVREQLPESRIVTEPMGRNTAAAVALATVAVERPDGEVMLVLPADLAIPADESLRDAVAAAERGLAHGALGVDRPLITFGVRPTAADPDASYIRPEPDAGIRTEGIRAFPVADYEARPTASRARELYESGSRLASTGVFMWQRGAIREAIEKYTPLLTLVEPAHRSEIALRAAYDRLQPLSIDEAVMAGAARDGRVVVVALPG